MITDSFASLTKLARQIASERHADHDAVTKELLHFEILQALLVSGSVKHLVFRGGAALRLCHGGLRYCDDLRFVGGVRFDPSIMSPFMDRLAGGVTERYGLAMKVLEHIPNQDDKVPLGHWMTKVQLPHQDRSTEQGYEIRIEVTDVPAHSTNLLQVHPLSDRLPYAYRSMSIRAESKEEILAEKIIALGARRDLKQSDLWDIYMLHQGQVQLNARLMWDKLIDYHLDPMVFLDQLETRIQSLRDDEAVDAFQKEMSRFLDGPNQELIQERAIIRQMLDVVTMLAKEAARNIDTSIHESSSGCRRTDTLHRDAPPICK